MRAIVLNGQDLLRSETFLTFSTGPLPLFRDGVIVRAVGVSGGGGERDRTVAKPTAAAH